MSHTPVTPAPARLNRSELAVPGSSPKMLDKAASSAADVIFLDLEDAVAPSDKPQARENIIQALNEVDYGAKTVSLRINGLDTPYMYRDLVDVLERTGERLDLVMVPKAGTAADIYTVDTLVSQLEAATGRCKRLGFELLIETALGMQNVEAVAAASVRNESLHFGVADYAASTGMRLTTIGGPNPNYHVLTDTLDDGTRHTHWGDMWHHAISKVVVAARANGLRPIDGPFGDVQDSDGFRAQAQRAGVLGCEGKWAIHPAQVELANAVNTPDPDAVAHARRILDAMAEAQAEGRGAVTLDGRMIDAASVRQARQLVDKADQIAGA